MEQLSAKHCTPCKEGSCPLKGQPLLDLYKQLSGWQLLADHHREKTYTFKNFKEALSFVNRIGELAEKEGHHPDIYLSWGKVMLTIWTHKIEGLTESDFVFAVKSDLIFSS
ncbi:MAG: 4a-hydroxytetrahydrobiopterin dehydratase [Verrucomicrobia bacterium]|nr:4a-hydroxytetrahydrobiopterin dehydratase [Verrucomicrobiota bacterium]